MGLFLVFILLSIPALAKVKVVSNYPLVGTNVEKVINENNYKDIVEILKAIETVKDVYVEETKEGITVYVERYPIVDRIFILGNRSIDEHEIKASAGLYEGMPWKDLSEEVITLRVKNLYMQEGFLDAKVATTVHIKENGYVDLYIGVDEEDIYFFKGAQYEGSTLDPKDLDKASKLVKGRIAKMEDFNEAVYNIEEYYVNSGFFDAVVFLKEVKREKLKRPYFRVLMPAGESFEKRPLTVLGSLAEGISNLFKHPIGTLKALTGTGNFAIPVYTVREGELYRVYFEGSHSFPYETLLQATGLKKEGVDLFTLEKAKENLVNFYNSKGYFDVKVSYKWLQNLVVFEVEEGQRYTYKEGFFDEEEVKRELDKELEKLRKAGFTLAEGSYTLKLDRDKKSVEVFFNIQKGKKPILERFVYVGDDKQIKRIFRDYNDKLPSAYDTKIIEDLNVAIREHFLKGGYMDGDFEIDVSIEERDNVLAYVYTYKINKGERYQLGEDIYYGAQKTTLREISYMTGKSRFYSKDLDDETLTNMLGTGIFSGVRIDTFVDRENKRVHRLIQFTEDKRGFLDFSLGYNTEENVAIDTLIGWKNLFGVGLNSSFRYRRTQKRELFNVEFTDSFLFTRRLWFKTSIFKNFEDHRSYDLDNRGINLSLGYRITRYTSIGPILSTTQNTALGKDYNISTFGVFLLREYRDDLFLPKRVHYNDVQLRFGRGDAKYTKFELKTFYFIPLRKDFNISFKLSGGYVSKSAPIFEKFFLGGLRDLRGYDYEEVGQPSGGNYYTFGRLELEIPLRKPIILALFTDAGNVGKNLEDTLRHPKWSFGSGLGAKTPIGPIRLDIAFPGEREFHKKPKLHLSVGYFY